MPNLMMKTKHIFIFSGMSDKDWKIQMKENIHNHFHDREEVQVWRHI
jgi:hypothetical protein